MTISPYTVRAHLEGEAKHAQEAAEHYARLSRSAVASGECVCAMGGDYAECAIANQRAARNASVDAAWALDKLAKINTHISALEAKGSDQ